MKIQLTKTLEKSSFNDNGSNTFKDIDTIYLKDVNINLVKNYFHYFRSAFIKASMEFVSKNPKQEQQGEGEAMSASAIALVLFNGDQEIIDKSNEILKKVAFKDDGYKNPLSENDLNNLDFQDWENIICEFLVNFWVGKWLAGGKKS
jgi:hypothetical protein